MRVVAGELGGRRLAGPGRGTRLRPTSDRVREALFSILGDVAGARVLDLYSGTGALAIEALSRGAGEATLVDRDIRLALRNVEELGLAGRSDVVRADALAHLRRDEREYDLILCDPPYRLAHRLEADLDKLVPPRLAPAGRLVTESAAGRPLGLSMGLELERRYGDTLLRIWKGAA